MWAVVAGVRLQLATFPRYWESLLALVMVPLTTTWMVMLTRYAGREDLAPYAIVAPALIAVWAMAVSVSGDIVDVDRGVGVLELLIGTPAPLGAVLLGRIATVTGISGLAMGESWLVAVVAFDVDLRLEHPVVLALALAVTLIAIAGTAIAFSGAFVIARSARVWQNSLNAPFLLLGGVLVPPQLLPEPLQVVSKVIFLSWSADLMRDSFSPGHVTAVLPRAAMVLVLAGASFVLGLLALRKVLTRVLHTGRVDNAW